MGQEIQRKDKTQDLTLISRTWLESWGSISVKADTPATTITCSNTPSLSQLGKDADGKEMLGIAIMDAQLTGIVDFTGTNVSPGQITECARLAYEEYHWLTLAELKQFILRIKTGVYSSHKNFSALLFMEYLKEYAEERMAHRYDHHSTQPIAYQPDPDAKPLTDEQMAELKEKLRAIAGAMVAPLKEIEQEEEYRRAKAEAHQKLMERRAQVEDTNNQNQSR